MQTPDVAPAAVARHVSAEAAAVPPGGAPAQPWPADLLQVRAPLTVKRPVYSSLKP